MNLIYDPKALITNYEQFPFYKKNNINAVVLANELKDFEVYECCKNKNDMQLVKQVSGYVFIMESSCQLISELKLTYKIKKFILKKQQETFQQSFIKMNMALIFVQDMFYLI